MTIIKATCPYCGDVELARDDVRLVVHPLADRSSYSFRCPDCGDDIRKPAGSEIIRLLKLGGVPTEHVDIPAEATEERTGAPICSDEVLDFVNWLRGADSIVAAASASLHRRADVIQDTAPQS